MSLNMPKSNHKSSTAQTAKSRVPIVLTEFEKKELLHIAEIEQRSAQAMAGIIYRMGMNAYLNRHVDKQ
jgi:hypothetical protein